MMSVGSSITETVCLAVDGLHKHVVTRYSNPAALFIPSPAASTLVEQQFNRLTSATREYETKMTLGNKKIAKCKTWSCQIWFEEGPSTLPV
jgi:hypothetical protein